MKKVIKINKILSIKNPDKVHNEIYTKDRDHLDFPKPFIGVVSGRPGCGKTNALFNLIYQWQTGKKPFKQIHIIHGSEYSNEYDILDATSIRPDIPSYLEFEDVDTHKLLIIDDYDFTSIDKQTAKNISELCRFGSSHHCISLVFINQSFFRMPKIVKDMANIFLIFRPLDLDEINSLGRRVSLKKNKLKDIFNEYLPNWRDSLLINLIPSNPYDVYWKNLYEPLDVSEILNEKY